MLFKYFVEFDEEGEIKNFYKSKNECKGCKEYLVKLIPIDRKQTNEATKELEQQLTKMDNIAVELLKKGKKLNTEFDKVVKDLRRIR